MALLGRLALLASIAWIVGLTAPLFELVGHPFSLRDLILIVGGFFLLYKATSEIHQRLEGDELHGQSGERRRSFGGVVAQIVVLDMVFSLDSVITAVGMANDLWVMAAAIVAAVVIMLVASGPLSAFVDRHPTVKMLALSFLLLIGMMLVADGAGFHVPKGYVYTAIGFSISIEALNQLAAQRGKRRKAAALAAAAQDAAESRAGDKRGGRRRLA
jgi:predicted tellurium resistance membrane protein TerC